MIEPMFASAEVTSLGMIQTLLAYQYLQVLPQIAQGESNKVWIIPSEVTQALGQLTKALPSGNAQPPEQS